MKILGFLVIIGSAMLDGASSFGYAESAITKLGNVFANCAWKAYRETELGRDGNAPAAVERAFADCRTEENAYYTTLAWALAIPPTSADEARLEARAMIDRLKAQMKKAMLASSSGTPSAPAPAQQGAKH